MGLRSSYLLLYNVSQNIGWLGVFVLLVYSLISTGSIGAVYPAVGKYVCILQLAQILETFHAIIGLVSTSIPAALVQWLGRTHILLAVIGFLPEVQSHVSTVIVFGAWALSEICRYPYYVATCLGTPPVWLKWLRYSAFLWLYPLGFMGEEWAAIYAYPIIEGKDVHQEYLSRIPYPIKYDHILLGVVLVGPFAFLLLLGYMLKQRKKMFPKKKRALRPKRD